MLREVPRSQAHLLHYAGHVLGQGGSPVQRLRRSLPSEHSTCTPCSRVLITSKGCSTNTVAVPAVDPATSWCLRGQGAIQRSSLRDKGRDAIVPSGSLRQHRRRNEGARAVGMHEIHRTDHPLDSLLAGWAIVGPSMPQMHARGGLRGRFWAMRDSDDVGDGNDTRSCVRLWRMGVRSCGPAGSHCRGRS